MKSFKDCRKIEHMDCVLVGLTVFRWAWLASTLPESEVCPTLLQCNHIFIILSGGKMPIINAFCDWMETKQFWGHSDFRWQGGVIWATTCLKDSQPLENLACGSFLYFTIKCALACLGGCTQSRQKIGNSPNALQQGNKQIVVYGILLSTK